MHQALPTHRKTMRLQALLHWKTPQALGHLCLLWLWALDSAPDGRLRAVSDEELAQAMQFNPRRAGELIEALLAAGFLDREADGTLRIHDWDSYGGKVLESRRKKTEEMRNLRKRGRCGNHVATTNQPRGEPRGSLDNTTKDNTTQDNSTQDERTEAYARDPPAPRPTDAIPLASSSMKDGFYREKLAALEDCELLSWCLSCAKEEGRGILSGSADYHRLLEEFRSQKG